MEHLGLMASCPPRIRAMTCRCFGTNQTGSPRTTAAEIDPAINKRLSSADGAVEYRQTKMLTLISPPSDSLTFQALNNAARLKEAAGASVDAILRHRHQ